MLGVWKFYVFRCHRGDRSIRSLWSGASLVVTFPDDGVVTRRGGSQCGPRIGALLCGSLRARHVLGDPGSPVALPVPCVTVCLLWMSGIIWNLYFSAATWRGQDPFSFVILVMPWSLGPS